MELNDMKENEEKHRCVFKVDKKSGCFYEDL